MITYTLTQEQINQLLATLSQSADAFFAGRDAALTTLQSLKPNTQEPGAYITETYQGPMVWTPEMYNEACTYCDEGECPVPLYTHPAMKETS